MAERYVGTGTELMAEVVPGDATPVAIAGLTSIDGPGGDTEEIDMTAHDSPGKFRQTKASFRDPGEVDFAGWLDPHEATHDKDTGIIHFWLDGLERLFRMRTPTGALLALEDFAEWPGFMRTLRLSTPFDNGIAFTGTNRLGGQPTFLTT